MTREEATLIWRKLSTLKTTITKFQKSAERQLEEIEKLLSDEADLTSLKTFSWSIKEDLDGAIADKLDPLHKEADEKSCEDYIPEIPRAGGKPLY